MRKLKLKKKDNQPRRKFKWTPSKIVLTVGIVVIMIPVIAFMVILIQAYNESGTPINGNRLQNERSVEITDAQLTEVDDAISAIDGVENVSVKLKVATMRVYIDVDDDIDSDAYADILNAAYEKINEILPIATYFTLDDTMKEYDLEIHAYNNIDDADSDTFIYYIMNKNSAMSDPETELVSEARNAELADELRGDTVASGTVEGEDSEDADSGE